MINGKYRARAVDNCKCQCFSHLNSFREDLNICVDDIHGKYLQFKFLFIYFSHHKIVNCLHAIANGI